MLTQTYVNEGKQLAKIGDTVIDSDNNAWPIEEIYEETTFGALTGKAFTNVVIWSSRQPEPYYEHEGKMVKNSVNRRWVKLA